MKVILHAAALRARYSVAHGEAVEIPDDLAAHYLNVGVAAPVRVVAAEKAERAPSFDLGAANKAELVAEAERRGVDVARADGEAGAPTKADYIRALGGEA